MRVFISYSHAQGEWVRDRLVPCLTAGGAQVLIDHERFRAGGGVYRQMDATQDQADKHVLVLSAAYLASVACQHEMKRAIKLDPKFEKNVVLPVRRDSEPIPRAIKLPNPLYVDLHDDTRADQWELLLRECDASLGATAPDWLTKRDEVKRLLMENKSVNLVVGAPVRWRGLIDDLAVRPELKLAVVDLEDPASVPRQGFIATILDALGAKRRVPDPPNDLPELARAMKSLGRSRVAVRHFDIVPHRSDYNADLFAALRWLVMDARQLVLLIQSRIPMAALLPSSHPMSEIDVTTVELRAQP